jgi:hypothetical protein
MMPCISSAKIDPETAVGVWLLDEAAIFNTVLSEDDLTTIVEHGLAKALGGLDVEPAGKLAITWGYLKANR